MQIRHLATHTARPAARGAAPLGAALAALLAGTAVASQAQAPAQAPTPAQGPAQEGFTQHGVHEHGRATLDVALDGGTLTVALTTPAINVLGFERRPRNDAERRAVADATALLGTHAQLFSFPVAARCVATGATVTPPEWGRSGGHRHEHGHDHKHEHGQAGGKDGHEHADYAARWTFQCANPAALGFFDAPLVARLQPETVVQANVLSAALQTRQELRAGSARVRLR